MGVLNGYCNEQFKQLGKFLPLSLPGHDYPCCIASHNAKLNYVDIAKKVNIQESFKSYELKKGSKD